jgi:hypothetical protein
MACLPGITDVNFPRIDSDRAIMTRLPDGNVLLINHFALVAAPARLLH